MNICEFSREQEVRQTSSIKETFPYTFLHAEQFSLMTLRDEDVRVDGCMNLQRKAVGGGVSYVHQWLEGIGHREL